METTSIKRKRCRTIELKTMFHGVANMVRVRGEKAYCQPIMGGLLYQFVIGDQIYKFSVQKGGAAC